MKYLLSTILLSLLFIACGDNDSGKIKDGLRRDDYCYYFRVDSEGGDNDVEAGWTNTKPELIDRSGNFGIQAYDVRLRKRLESQDILVKEVFILINRVQDKIRIETKC